MNLLSLYTLIFALFGKTDGMINDLRKMEVMKNSGVNFGLDPSVTDAPIVDKNCYNVPIPCNLLREYDGQLPPEYLSQIILLNRENNDEDKDEVKNRSLFYNNNENDALNSNGSSNILEDLWNEWNGTFVNETEP